MDVDAPGTGVTQRAGKGAIPGRRSCAEMDGECARGALCENCAHRTEGPSEVGAFYDELRRGPVMETGEALLEHGRLG